MLFFGMFATLFWKGTRFWDLNKQLTNLNKKKLVLLPFLFSMGVLFGQNNTDSIENEIQTVETIDSIPTSHKEVRDIQPTEQFSTPEELGKPLHIDLDHANQFGHILVQDFTGRIKPMNTHTLELMRKIHKKIDLSIKKPMKLSPLSNGSYRCKSIQRLGPTKISLAFRVKQVINC